MVADGSHGKPDAPAHQVARQQEQRGSDAQGTQVKPLVGVERQAGRRVRPAAVLQNREARLPFVLAGVGATFLERSMARSAAARGAIVRAVEPPISRPYGLVYDPAALSPVGQAFVGAADPDVRPG